jgi:hypothetical protein
MILFLCGVFSIHIFKGLRETNSLVFDQEIESRQRVDKQDWITQLENAEKRLNIRIPSKSEGVNYDSIAIPIAAKTGVRVLSIKTIGTEEFTNTGKPGDKGAALGTLVKGEMQIEGPFNNLLIFLKEVENGIYPVVIDDCQISPAAGGVKASMHYSVFTTI